MQAFLRCEAVNQGNDNRIFGYTMLYTRLRYRLFIRGSEAVCIQNVSVANDAGWMNAKALAINGFYFVTRYEKLISAAYGNARSKAQRSPVESQLQASSNPAIPRICLSALDPFGPKEELSNTDTLP